MQNRRLLRDDDRGVEEALNEIDANGEGLKVFAKYHLEFFDTSLGHSQQR